MGVRPNSRPLAYGSLYNPSPDFIEIDVRQENQRVDFTTNGPLFRTSADFENDELVVLTGGVYEISMNVTIQCSAFASSPPSNVIFRLFINENTPVLESDFELFNNIVFAGIQPGQGIQSDVRTTIGKTIQLELEPNDRLSVKYDLVGAGGLTLYRQPSLTATKLDE
ncbi:hypothetical protein [Ammoniphilus resinae]|uniref:Uncharacterized protein n=1 Tax=Ammoniphilus resinae TaxID=861532 RepID=A0ABS4GVH1_9BACL|nr:hypothetical protein [Ammoniphilus resinae]MBP1934280.1 hypothetical protein [Ammoniphilus resinae]